MIAIYEQNLVALELMPMIKPVANTSQVDPQAWEWKTPLWGKVTSLSEIIIGYCVHLVDSELDTTHIRAGTILDQLSGDYRIWRSMLDRRDLRTLYTSLFQEPLWCETHGSDAIEIKFKWEPVEWLGRFTMDLPFFSPFILQEERQQFPNVRTSRRDGECSHRSFPSLEPTGNMRKKRHVFFVCNKGHCANTALC